MPDLGRGERRKGGYQDRRDRCRTPRQPGHRKHAVPWLAIDDEPGPRSLRAYIERNSIALLSNYNKTPLDPPSRDWLGYSSCIETIKNAGLWNQDHVMKTCDARFLDTLDQMISTLGSPA
jgi:hypothetical protein